MQSAIIKTHQLQRMLNRVTVLNNITAEVYPGQTVALLGKNGAGKTTLLETLLGFGMPASGESLLWGCRATDIGGDIKQRIGFVPQQDELLPNFTGKEHLELFKHFRQHWSQALVDKLIREWLIPMDVNVVCMSVGQRQKLSILFAIAHEPELLILDEPVASLDPIARRQFLQQLVEIAADEQRAVIFSSHIVSDVERVADQVWILRDGELAYQGDLDALKESVARVSLPASLALPDMVGADALISERADQYRRVITLKSLTPECERELQRLHSEIQVERLGLEDIFLEMNA